jgi:redox-sensing transcriptional repressor
VIIVGAGRIGTALAQYPGFGQRGFRVVAVFDRDPARIGEPYGDVIVRDVATLADEARRLRADIAVLAAPAHVAQDMLDRIAATGVRAVLNFASTPLVAPPGVTVKSVDMAMELEALSYTLAHDDGR